MIELPPNGQSELQAARDLSPPRVELAFRVGIIGHRPNRLGRADLPLLAERVQAILAAVRDAVEGFQRRYPGLYAETAAIFRAVTPLAEGADRLFAQQALSLGYALCCPLPFAQDEYEVDFQPPRAQEPDSLARFRGLLDEACAGAGLVLFELDGDRAPASAAYAAAGQVVLTQSDLLIAIWDGGEPAGNAGTVDSLRDAVQERIPVLVLDACTPHGWTLVRNESDLDRLRPCTDAGEAAGASLDWDGLRTLVWGPWTCLRTLPRSARGAPSDARTTVRTISRNGGLAGTSPLPGGSSASCTAHIGCGCPRCGCRTSSRRTC